MFEKQEQPQEKTPAQIVAEGDEKRARGEPLRDDERKKYNAALSAKEGEEFVRGEGPVNRAVERETQERQEQREKAQEVIQRRITELEDMIANRKSQIETLGKEITGLQEEWSNTDDAERKASKQLAYTVKEQMLAVNKEELDRYLKELEEQELEMEKSKL